MKTCTKCKIEQPLTNFVFMKGRNRHFSSCKACMNAVSKVWRQNNRERHNKRAAVWAKKNPDSQRNTRLKACYGITLADYEAMFELQKGLCAVCKAPGKLVVDHDHETNKIRGLLHSNCNTALGLMNESFDGVLGLAKYIQEHKGVL